MRLAAQSRSGRRRRWFCARARGRGWGGLGTWGCCVCKKAAIMPFRCGHGNGKGRLKALWRFRRPF
ncbi:hypothetical protein HMPREF9120_01254 [Neisseria sp. oral taxon 020 str. F0370]|nr:hypothetical protein HMPREF9120_01254 [Neisseria sp. oral taxon 020 str. F0370]